MSSNDVKIEKQVNRHRGPLVGIAVGAVFVALIMVYMLSSVFDGEVEPSDGPAVAPAEAVAD